MDQGRKKTSLVLSSAHSLRRPYNSLPGEGSLSRGLFPLLRGSVFHFCKEIRGGVSVVTQLPTFRRSGFWGPVGPFSSEAFHQKGNSVSCKLLIFTFCLGASRPFRPSPTPERRIRRYPFYLRARMRHHSQFNASYFPTPSAKLRHPRPSETPPGTRAFCSRAYPNARRGDWLRGRSSSPRLPSSRTNSGGGFATSTLSQ
jgi:hypothetical protein